ncbi:hypothetical protein [Tardiphaga sp. 709]|uniref:hypothetical protein n=1 Tax=Tardiphaga sp. 709 TaxID=3076039 RepID=UPI0028ECEA8A|nr:hypothetical protein [Tardiphaga sp. 709]WNV09596.1 hypothetical protein RSO67_29810 [Tardiphaga sp. 709]
MESTETRVQSWGLQSLQAVWFTQSQLPDVAAVFTAATGAKPDNVQQPSIGLSLATGSDGKHQFHCQAVPGRTDFFKFSIPGQGVPLDFEVSSCLADFEAGILRAGDVVGPANRLALVSNLLREVGDQAEASDIIAKLVGWPVPFPDAQDLNIQVNRRARLSTGTSVNRLVRWFYQSLQEVVVGAVPAVKMRDFAALALDINTVPSELPATFNSAEQALIWKSICEESNRLLADRSLSSLK